MLTTAPPEPVTGAPRSVVVFSDVACPWSTVVVLRLHAARRHLGLVDDVAILHLAHPLELLLDRPLARRVIDAEIPGCAAAVPDFGWSLWQGRLDEWPVSSLPAVEAVQAARRQSERAAEQLDLELRRALFVESRCITLRHEIARAGQRCPDLDVPELLDDLDSGDARAALVRQSRAARGGAASCSGYVVLPNGDGHCNPGVSTSWLGSAVPRGVPQVLADDPEVYRDIVLACAGATEPTPRGGGAPQGCG